MKLYWFSSFNPQKVRFALAELDLPYERQTVNLFQREHRQDWYQALAPTGQVPVLEVDGERLWESNAILAYLGEKEARLWPGSALQKAQALQWMFFEAYSLVQGAGPLWFYQSVGPKVGIKAPEGVIQRAQDSIRRPLRLLESHLGERPFMMGTEFSLVDCSLATTLHALSASEYSIEEHKAIGAYLERVRARPGWQSCEFEY